MLLYLRENGTLQRWESPKTETQEAIADVRASSGYDGPIFALVIGGGSGD